MKKKRKDLTRFWVGLIVVGALLVALMNYSTSQAGKEPRAGFSDATPLGGKGLRLVLENLGYTVARQSEPLRSMPAGAKVWLILDPETRFTTEESKRLLAWVKKGGVLLFCVRPDGVFGFSLEEPSEGIEWLHDTLNISHSDFQVPGATDLLPPLTPLALDNVSNYRNGVKKASGSSRSFQVGRPHLEVAGSPGGIIARIDAGAGHVFVLPDALLVTNYALSKDDNTTLVTNLLRAHAPKGAVYFDERNHGKSAPAPESTSLISYLKKPPVVYAIWQLLVAGLLFWAFAGRRLGAPVPIPGSGPVTRASQFAAAMGALFSKTNRPKAAATLIGNRFRRRLAQRLGLSPADSDAVLARRAQEVSGIPFEVTDRLLLQSRAPAVTVAEALRDAQQMEAVLRQLEGKS
jgi:hypothetical protein